MALLLSNHVLKALQLTADDSVKCLEEKLRELEPGFLDIISSAVGCKSVMNLATNPREETVEIFPAIIPIEKWLYHQIKLNETIIGEVVKIPKEIQAVPSNEAELALVRAWNLSKELLKPNEQKIKKAHVILIWKKAANQLPLDSGAAILSLLGVKKEITPLMYQPPWLEKTTLRISQTSRLISQSIAYSTLLTLAAQEKSIRWRFLGFYRLLERGYLDVVLDSINQTFFQAPKAAIENAEKTLSNEINQLVELVAKYQLVPFFEQFARQMKNLKNQNRYATMLEREYDAEPRKKDFQGEFKKGVLLCYKIRCSIVHASGTSLIFENFEDGEEALLALMVPLEQAVLKILTIEVQ